MTCCSTLLGAIKPCCSVGCYCVDVLVVVVQLDDDEQCMRQPSAAQLCMRHHTHFPACHHACLLSPFWHAAKIIALHSQKLLCVSLKSQPLSACVLIVLLTLSQVAIHSKHAIRGQGGLAAQGCTGAAAAGRALPHRQQQHCAASRAPEQKA